MRVIYIAKHHSGGNDEEGAIAHALTQLGHKVVCISEVGANVRPLREKGDFLLFHKWRNLAALQAIKMPKVFWFWDLVELPSDPMLRHRDDARKNWMEAVVPNVDLGFLSDGDWVAQDKSGKLSVLRQGADERIAGKGLKHERAEFIDILFTGIRQGGGSSRHKFVDRMKSAYGSSFQHVASGFHGKRLADLIANSRIVVAPDSPVTDRYWSNRIYLTLGFGGFLIHPYSEGLVDQYEGGKEVFYYRSFEGLQELIGRCLADGALCERVAEAGYRRTMREHTYRHRCEKLVAICKERGLT